MPDALGHPEPVEVDIVVNGRERSMRLQPHDTLAEVLRDRLALTGTKVSCNAQVCGACTVLVDGMAVSSCNFLAMDADGRSVRTVEGLASQNGLSALQRAFIDEGGFQCGFCTPGMLMAATALLEEIPHPTEQEVVEALEGNLCRCTGYRSIVDAILRAANEGVGHD